MFGVTFRRGDFCPLPSQPAATSKSLQNLPQASLHKEPALIFFPAPFCLFIPTPCLCPVLNNDLAFLQLERIFPFQEDRKN